ncbi:hypothetical protein, partial [Pseudomonas fluorescens]|uniref:hypothetical protein n=1 Tax=Pseudomonas fluorescens TaxID=294 RepID=UPI001BB36ABA
LFGYFCVFTKVTRRKGGTLSSRYRSNGYVHQQPHYSDAGTPISLSDRGDAIAGKPAPTFSV